MPVRRIDHISMAMPAGREEEARAFYHGILGLNEQVKPCAVGRTRWLLVGKCDVEVHLGVEKNFTPARKAHPAFIVDDLVGMVKKAEPAGLQTTADEPIEGCDRRHVEDPFGNGAE